MIKYMKALMLMFVCNFAYASNYTPDIPLETISAGMPSVEKNIREASVRVTAPFTGGPGSGSYIKYKDLRTRVIPCYLSAIQN